MSAVRHGGRILADALVAHGVKVAFGVPGESYLPVLDGLHDHRERLRFIVCRQEGGASYMAEGYGKLTGEPGVLFVTRGPGATKGSVGVHTAMQDSTPMVVFVGQVGNDMAEREAFQEIDYRRMWAADEMGRADRSRRTDSEYVSHAFHTAWRDARGPCCLHCRRTRSCGSGRSRCAALPHGSRCASPGHRELKRLAGAAPDCDRRRRRLTRDALERLRRWAEGARPAHYVFRCQDYVDNRRRACTQATSRWRQPEARAVIRMRT